MLVETTETTVKLVNFPVPDVIPYMFWVWVLATIVVLVLGILQYYNNTHRF